MVSEGLSIFLGYEDIRILNMRTLQVCDTVSLWRIEKSCCCFQGDFIITYSFRGTLLGLTWRGGAAEASSHKITEGKAS